MIAGTMRKRAPVDWSEYGLREYLLVVRPDKEIARKIGEEKKYFTKNYLERSALKTQPHITIANFLGKEHMEGTLTRWIRHICNSYTSFTVTLDNFSGFVPHTIFLQIENVQPFKQLAANLKALDHFIRANDCPPLKLVTTPHLPIARRLPEQVYFRALQEYMQRPFRQSFAVNNLVLVKRTGEHAACQAVQVFALPEPGTCFN